MSRNPGEIMFAVVSKVPIHLPSLSKIVRSFDQHGGRSESLETNDDVRKVKLCLEVEAYRDIFHPVLSLPP